MQAWCGDIIFLNMCVASVLQSLAEKGGVDFDAIMQSVDLVSLTSFSARQATIKL